MANEFIARNGITSLGNIVVSGSITTTGTVAISGSIASASFAATASSADNLLVRSTLTAQTLVVQTITSSVDFVTGSTRFGSLISNTHVFTGSMSVTGALYVPAGRVGIGTTSPTFKLDVQDSSQAIVRILDTSTSSSLVLQAGTGTSMKITGYNYATATAVPLYISVDGADTILQRNGGNVGIGTTSPTAKLQVQGSSSGISDDGIFFISTNTASRLTFGINEDNYAYIRSAEPGVAYRNLILQPDGGNVGIGTTNPDGRLQVQVDSNFTGGVNYTTPHLFIRSGASAASGNVTRLALGVFDGAQIYLDGICTSTGGGTADLAIATRNGGAPTEKMRITAGGNVGIGSTNPVSKLSVVGGNNTLNSGNPADYSMVLQDPTSMAANVGGSLIFQGYKNSTTALGNYGYVAGRKENGTTSDESGYLSFGTFNSGGTGAERMRITSGGKILIGASELGDSKVQISGHVRLGTWTTPNTTYIGYGRNDDGSMSSAGSSGFAIESVTTSGNNYSQNIMLRVHFYNGGTREAIRCNYNGDVYNYQNSTTWQQQSDIRIKTNIRPINDALDKIISLNPTHFEYKNNLGKTKTGFIAQEFENVFPGHVSETIPSETFKEYFEEGDMIKTIDADLVPYLVKAIQELTARVQELENK